MKEAIGSIPIIQIVIILLLVFTGIMCLTINHSRALGVKDEILNILQDIENPKAELDDKTINRIKDHINESGYRVTGSCPSGYTGYDREGNKKTADASFCIKANDVAEEIYGCMLYNDDGCKSLEPENLGLFYYDIVLFYQLDIPGLNNVMNFKLNGSTKNMMGIK